jgi:hypothetical protein
MNLIRAVAASLSVGFLVPGCSDLNSWPVCTDAEAPTGECSPGTQTPGSSSDGAVRGTGGSIGPSGGAGQSDAGVVADVGSGAGGSTGLIDAPFQADSPGGPAGASGGQDAAPQPGVGMPAAPGTLIWKAAINGWGQGVAVDSAGNIVFAGSTFSSGDPEGDIVLGKYSPAGTRLWQKSFGGPGRQGAYDLAIGPDGTIVLTGGYEGTGDFGGQTKTSAGAADVFVASYSGDGDLKTAASFGGPASEGGLGVLIDGASGDWFVTGYGGSTPLGAETIEREFLFRMRPSGEILWGRHSGSTGLASTRVGDSLFAIGDISMQQVSRHSLGSGTADWTTSLGPDVDGQSITLGREGNILITGGFAKLTIGTGPMTGTYGERDVLLASLAADTGRVLWSDVVVGSRGDDIGVGVCEDAAGGVYVVGTYAGTDQFVKGEGAGASPTAFIAKYDGKGIRAWIKALPAPDANTIICDDRNGLIVGANGYLFKVAP